MAAYVHRASEATCRLKKFPLLHIPWSKNHQADSLSKLASSSTDEKARRIQWETLLEWSIEPKEILWLNRSSTWMDPIKAYLSDDALPTGTKESEQVKKLVEWFILYERILYKCSHARPLLCCVTPKMRKDILEEVHEGVCSSHIGGLSLIHI